MREPSPDTYRHAVSLAARALLVVAVVSPLQSCRDGHADPVENARLTEQQQLIGALYARSDATMSWWPTLREAPAPIQHSAERADHILAALPQTEVSAFSIAYGSNDLPQIALWIRRPSNQELVVYNHGHGGLPQASEEWAIRFLRLAVESGKDILLTSMPLTGLNAPAPGTEYHILTSDSAAPTSVDADVLSSFPHELYELIDDPDTYLHYFIDGAVLPVALLSQRSSARIAVSPPQVTGAPPPSPGYLGISYVGLSGGATTGLVACAVLSARHCVLVAGVMPLDLRAKYFKNFGDAEQASRHFYRRFNVERLLGIADASTDALVMLFNERDPCCFADPSASEFQQRYPAYDIRVLPLDFHGYEPETVVGILSN